MAQGGVVSLGASLGATYFFLRDGLASNTPKAVVVAAVHCCLNIKRCLTTGWSFQTGEREHVKRFNGVVRNASAPRIGWVSAGSLGNPIALRPVCADDCAASV